MLINWLGWNAMVNDRPGTHGIIFLVSNNHFSTLYGGYGCLCRGQGQGIEPGADIDNHMYHVSLNHLVKPDITGQGKITK